MHYKKRREYNMDKNNKDSQLDFFEEGSDAVSNAIKNVEEFVLDSMKEKEPEKKLIETERGEKFTEEEWGKPIFDNGPIQQEVEEWKDKYGNVYFISLADQYYVFRSLARSEYRETINNQKITLLDREEIFTDTCVLFPRNYKTSKVTNGNAGVPSALAEAIMEKSGFVAQTAPIKL